jgi:hypothetical protein
MTNYQIFLDDNAIFPGVEGVVIPKGSTLQRGADAAMIRFNTTLVRFEGTTDGTNWNNFGIGDGSVTSIDINTSSIGLNISGAPIINSGTIAIDLSNSLNILSALSGNGFIGVTSTPGANLRTFNGTSDQINVANGDGVSGNPTLSLANNIIMPGSGGATLPKGDNFQRVGAQGTLRFNTTLVKFEGTEDGTNWVPFNTSLASVTSVAVATSSTGVSISGSPITTSGTINVDISSQLQALSGLSGTGIMVRTGSPTYAFRTITGTTSQITITNGNGVSGNPVISMPTTVVITTSVRAGNIQIGSNGFSTNSISSQDTNGNILLDPNGTGWVGINFSGSKTGLQFNNQTQNRIITLYERFDNPHEYYGFGVNSSSLRYQIGRTTANHEFWAAVDSSSSNLVGTITGTGDMSIPGTYYGRSVSGLIYQSSTSFQVVTGGVWVKVAGTTASLQLNGFSMSSNNRIRCDLTTGATCKVSLTMTIRDVSAMVGNYSIAVYKNGTRLTETIMESDTPVNLTNVNMYTFTYVSLALNDYVEAYYVSGNNTTMAGVYMLLSVEAI